jgi:prepilin-type N-terminal cleavage/methylation domain-containing protein
MQKGFTLIEALIGIAIITLVAASAWSFVAEAGGGPLSNAVTESNEINRDISRSVPIPQLVTSSERKNVAKRAELFDTEGKISYIYLVSYGKVMAFFTVEGKVSSLRSYMTPVDKLITGNGNDCAVYTSYCYVVNAPDLDGTYGENVEGIFFFTTEGAYVEWKGEYMMSDQPLKLSTPPELVRQIN